MSPLAPSPTLPGTTPAHRATLALQAQGQELAALLAHLPGTVPLAPALALAALALATVVRDQLQAVENALVAQALPLGHLTGMSLQPHRPRFVAGVEIHSYLTDSCGRRQLVVSDVESWKGGSKHLQTMTPGEALAAILRPEARGGLPERRPLHTTLPDPYTWRGYRALIAYLRDHTAPRTRVANCLAFMPAVCGPAGRLPAMPGESLAWFQYFKDDENLQNAYARRLAETPDSVVVWSPAEAPTIPGPLLAVIRGAYEPSARFGPVEVWRRRPGGPPVPEK